MYIDIYFQELKKVLDKIEKTQKSTIEECAKVIAKSIASGGCWHIQDSGHMLTSECIDRAGGLAAIKPMHISIDVKDNVRARPDDNLVNIYKMPELADVVLKASKLRRGDVLIIGSTSGYSVFPVELALKAKEIGVTTIAVTAKAYSDSLTPEHPSGLRLYEACDYMLDNCSNVGDAIVHIEEVNKNIAPASGIGAAYLMWALQIGVAEELIKLGIDPSIYISVHAPGGVNAFKEASERYEKEGY